jgi:hypothetical protein
MSVLNAIRPCPCHTWRCRLYRAGRALAVIVLAAGITIDTLMLIKFGVI